MGRVLGAGSSSPTGETVSRRRTSDSGAPHPIRSSRRHGIARRPNSSRPQPRPLTVNHELVYAHVTSEIRGPSVIARETGLAIETVQSALYVLASRGLVMRLPYQGWRRIV